jgi:hypothetical protein
VLQVTSGTGEEPEPLENPVVLLETEQLIVRRSGEVRMSNGEH